MVEINGEAKLSCLTPLKKLENASVNTLEGLPESIKDILAKSFVEKGAVQCGFCTPGFLMRTNILLQKNLTPTLDQIKQALTLNLCRCTGYVKITDAIHEASQRLQKQLSSASTSLSGNVGTSYPRYEAYEMALGKKLFVNDLHFNNMLHGALYFSDYPKATILNIETSEALKIQGVVRVFTAADIEGDRFVGLIYKDWPVMIKTGETTRYIGDVVAGVVAETEEIARKAVKAIKITYDILKPVTDPHEAIKPRALKVHPDRENLLETCRVYRGGNADEIIASSTFIAKGVYQTQRIEHAFLETEGAVAFPLDD
jgi:hypothetical protein